VRALVPEQRRAKSRRYFLQLDAPVVCSIGLSAQQRSIHLVQNDLFYSNLPSGSSALSIWNKKIILRSQLQSAKRTFAITYQKPFAFCDGDIKQFKAP